MDSPGAVVLHVVTKSDPDASRMVTETVSLAESTPSEAVSVSVTVVSESTSGAVNVVDMAVALSKAMAMSVELWDHR